MGGRSECAYLRAPVYIRVNRLLASVAQVISWLNDEGIEVKRVPGAADALQVTGTLPKPLATDGRISIQDAGSQMIAPLLQVEPGMRVVDACAGAGGKTLHLAALMEGAGEILALDIEPRKLAVLKQRAGRAEARNVRLERWSSTTLDHRRGWADRVLIDAPCSGLGTIRRQPDLKWRLSPDRLTRLQETQADLLARCAQFLKPGGKLVYATCSILDLENQHQIDRQIDSGWTLEETMKISPAETGWDGFYGARMTPS